MWQAEAGRLSAQPTRRTTLAGYSLSSYFPISKWKQTAVLESGVLTEVRRVNVPQSLVVGGCSVALVPRFGGALYELRVKLGDLQAVRGSAFGA